MLIKFRDGYTPTGSQAANFLSDRRSHPNQTKHTPDSRARRNGEFINVTRQKLDAGYFALGTVGGGLHVVSSNGLNAFVDRGLAPGGITGAGSGLQPYGKGKGGVWVQGDSDFYLDFAGLPARVTQVFFKLTKDGETFSDLVDFFVAQPPTTYVLGPFLYAFTGFFFTPGGMRDVGGTPTYYSGQAFTGLAGDGQYYQAFLCDDGQTRSLGATFHVPNQLGLYASTNTLAPGVILKMDRYIRPVNYTEPEIDPALCPGLRFYYSTDGGGTWASTSSHAMFAAELATITAMPPGSANSGQAFLDAMLCANIRTAPLTRSLSVAIGWVPYVELVTSEEYPSGIYVVKVKVKLGLVNAGAGCSILPTLTLFDGTPEAALRFCSRDPLAIPGGVLVFTRPDAGGAEWNAPARVMFTPNGTDLTERAFMPLPEFKTGVPTGESTSSLVCPMYDSVDGAYKMYASKDWGITWKARTTISDTAAAPATGTLDMTNFTFITILRRDGVPANAAPATPWLHDCRYPDPPPV